MGFFEQLSCHHTGEAFATFVFTIIGLSLNSAATVLEFILVHGRIECMEIGAKLLEVE